MCTHTRALTHATEMCSEEIPCYSRLFLLSHTFVRYLRSAAAAAAAVVATASLCLCVSHSPHDGKHPQNLSSLSSASILDVAHSWMLFQCAHMYNNSVCCVLWFILNYVRCARQPIPPTELNYALHNGYNTILLSLFLFCHLLMIPYTKLLVNNLMTCDKSSSFRLLLLRFLTLFSHFRMIAGELTNKLSVICGCSFRK